MQEIHYRTLVHTDYDDYQKIRLQCLAQFPDNFGSTFSEEAASKKLKLHDAIINPDVSNFAYGAYNDKNLIGICGFVAENRLKTRHRGEIVQMYVDPNFGDQGIGKKLLKLSLAKAFENPTIEQIILSAVAFNKGAVKLYESVGFKRYGYIENYFKCGNNYSPQIFMYQNRA